MLELEISTLFALIGVITLVMGIIYSSLHPLRFKSKRMTITWIGVVVLLLGGIVYV